MWNNWYCCSTSMFQFYDTLLYDIHTNLPVQLSEILISQQNRRDVPIFPGRVDSTL